MKGIACGIIALFAASGAAVAGCPGHVSSLPGIKLSRAAPFLAGLYRQTPKGLTEVLLREQDGVREETLTLFAHPMATATRTSASGTLEMAYGTDPAGLDALPDSESWQSTVVLLLNGKPILEGEVEFRLAGTEMATIGTCQTKVWLVENRQDFGGDDDSWTLLSYAPALGLVIGSVTMSATGKPTHRQVFDAFEVLTE